MSLSNHARVATALMLACSVAVSLIAAEIALRMIGFEFALYPSQVQFGWPDPVTLKRHYRIDKDLLWVPRDYPTKVAAWNNRRPALVLMGDSCTEFGAYGEFLGALIDAHDPSARFTIVNMGVGGWSSYQGLQQLKRDILPMKPRAVTIYYGWNDHWATFGIEDKVIGRYNLDRPGWQVMASRSRVVQLCSRAVYLLKQSMSDPDARRPERVSLADFVANVTEMVELCRDHDVTPILLTAPSSHETGAEPAHLKERWLNSLSELVPLHQAYVDAVRRVALNEEAPLVDLDAEFRRLPREDRAGMFQTDGIHLTEAGDRKVAELIGTRLMELQVNAQPVVHE